MNYRRLTGALLSGSAPATVGVALGGLAVALVLGGLQPFLVDAVVPRPGVWMQLAGLSMLAGLAIVAPAALTAGGVSALARWKESGAWIGLRSMGIRGHQLAPAALVLGLLGAMLAGLGTQWIGPASRAQIRELGRLPSAVELVPEAELRVGSVQLIAGGVEAGWATRLFFAGEDAVGSAERGRLIAHADGAALELVQGVLASAKPVPVRLSFRRWVLPLDHPPRVELDELTGAELLARAQATAATGNDASYEHAVAYKRWLHPLAMFLLPFSLLPLGVTRHPMAAVGAAGVLYLVAVRVGDQLVYQVGAVAAASTGPLAVAILGILLWAGWKDR